MISPCSGVVRRNKKFAIYQNLAQSDKLGINLHFVINKNMKNGFTLEIISLTCWIYNLCIFIISSLCRNKIKLRGNMNIAFCQSILTFIPIVESNQGWCPDRRQYKTIYNDITLNWQFFCCGRSYHYYQQLTQCQCQHCHVCQ